MMIHKAAQYLKEFVESVPPLRNVKEFAQKNPKQTTAALGVIVAIWLARRYHHKLVTHPSMGGRHNSQNIPPFQHPKNRGLTTQDLTLTSQGGVKLRGWYVTQPQGQSIMVYLHQNAGNIGGRIPYIEEVVDKTNCNVIIVAYRGFSDSDGTAKPTERELITDASTILNYASQVAENEKLPLFVFGRSLGGATCLGAVAETDFPSVRGIILENTFTSLYDVAVNIPLFRALWPLVWVITKGSFNSAKRISKVKLPILFIKGCKDELIPKRLMDRLEEICKSNKMETYCLQVPNGTHNDTWNRAGQSYFQTVNEFMLQCARL